MEQSLERTYETWENLIQGIRSNSDIERFQLYFDRTQNFFETELNKKKECLTAFRAQNNKELIEKNEQLKNLQNQYFESNATKEMAIEQLSQNLRYTSIIAADIWRAEIILSTIYDKFCQKAEETFDSFQNVFINFTEQQQNEVQQNGLAPRRIRRFQVFTADETHVGDQCSICMEEIDFGRRLRRLTCDGQHYFCQECIEGWFAEHNTCPLCRHKFD